MKSFLGTVAVILTLTGQAFAVEATLKCSVSGVDSNDKEINSVAIVTECIPSNPNDIFNHVHDCRGSLQVGDATIEFWEGLTREEKHMGGSISITDSVRLVQTELRAGTVLQYVSLDPNDPSKGTALLHVNCEPNKKAN